MIKQVRKENGITLVALVITIIVLIIIAGISVWVGADNIEQSRDSLANSELSMVQHAILEQYQKYLTTNNEADLKGSQNNEQAQSIATELGVTLKTNTGYYVLTPDDLPGIGIKDSKDTYIVNYQTGEVINYTKKRTKVGKVLYLSAIEKVEEKQETTKEGYIKANLLFCYDAMNNTGNGHSMTATTWKDLSGNNKDGILTNNPSWNTNNLQLDGIDDWVNCGKIDFTKEVTIETVITVADTAPKRMDLIGNWETGGGGIATDANGQMQTNLYIQNQYYYVYSGQMIQPGKSYSLTVTYDNTAIKLYINGKRIGQTNITGDIGLPLRDMVVSLGANIDGVSPNIKVTNPFKGYYHAARMYHKALTETEIKQNYETDKNRYGI